eukprot:CAMPEP_0184328300 /NCGR_PEP_ID=MMETSP1049-20130417/143549_1 /TAXON_ID=77928 /ORGANISM="Proteomonas sulcata, Strain CCMP704" /LENGTH=284 /DNA_ID=CAMNT_0026650603 /DNA_START=213 /DNA_END=1064 /DNA_ORIENTATION=-
MPETLSEHKKPFADAKLPVNKARFALTVVGSMAAGFIFRSGALTAVLLGALGVDQLANLLSNSIMYPPFLVCNKPEEGLHTIQSKLCPYWPKETVQGPSSMGLTYEDVQFVTSDNLTLRGWLVTPKISSSTLVILYHGNGRDRRAWLRHCPFLLDQGYTCMLFDARNHGVSDPSSVGGSTLGLLEWQDVRAAVHWARSSHPEKKIALMGTSAGAVAAITALAVDKQLQSDLCCVVAENPFASIDSLVQDVVCEVGFKIILCKRSVLAYWLVYPVAQIVKYLSIW